MPPIDRHLAISLVDELTAVVEPVLATAANRGEVRAVLTALAAVSASVIAALDHDEPLTFFLDVLKSNLAHAAG
jgi:hypothetical protein